MEFGGSADEVWEQKYEAASRRYAQLIYNHKNLGKKNELLAQFKAGIFLFRDKADFVVPATRYF